MGLLDNFDLGGATRGLLEFIANTNPEIRAERAQAEERKRQAERQRIADQMAQQQFEMQRAQFDQQRGLLAQQQADEGLLKRGLLLPEMEGARPADGMGPGAPMPTKGIDPQWFLSQGGSVGGLGKALEMNKALFPSGPKPADALAKINPADYTPESFREFMSTGDAGKLVPYRKPEGVPSAVQEYQFAVSQGYKGNFEQYQRDMKRAGATSVTVSTGQKDANWGTPPKDMVWARDAAGNVMTEQDPKTGARRPIATPIGGGDAASQKNEAISSMEESIRILDKAITHPGLNTATGVSGMVDPRNFIPGTDATNFRILADQIGGRAFLQAFESLKGGGQITETEGRKATDAIARLNRAQSDAEYMAALQEFRGIIAGAYKRATGREIPSPAATGQRKIKRTGTLNGRKVVEYEDGSIEYAN